MAVPVMTNDSPTPGSISWGLFHIQYEGVGYEVAAGSTSDRWVWWRYNAGNPVIQTGATVPEDLSDDDLLLFGNKDGVAVRMQSANLIDGELIVDGSILSDAIAANAITSAKIEAGAVIAGKIDAGAVTAEKIAADAVIAEKIEAGAVIAEKIATDAVTANKIEAGAVIAEKIAADAVTANKIEAGAVVAGKIGAGAVTANEIAAGAVVAGKIAAGAVTANELAANSVQAGNLSALLAILGTLLVGDGTGRTITIDPTNGITVVDQSGATVFQVPTSLQSDINMTADVVARSLTATGVVALRNPINEVAPGGVLYLRKGTTPPRTPLIVENNWPSEYIPQMWGYGHRTFLHNRVLYFVRSSGEVGGSGFDVVNGKNVYYFDFWKYDLTTKVVSFMKRAYPMSFDVSWIQQIVRLGVPLDETNVAVGTAVYAGLGGNIFPGNTGQGFAIHLWDKNWTYLRTIRVPDIVTAGSPAGSAQLQTKWPSIAGFNATTLAVYFADNTGKVRCYTMSITGAANSTPAFNYLWTSTLDLGTPGTGDPQVWGTMFGGMDYGDGLLRTAVLATTSTSNTRAIYILNASGVYNSAENFPIPPTSGVTGQILWDEMYDKLYTTDDNGNLWYYNDNRYPVASDATLWLSSTWESADGKSTTEGPVTKFTASKRAKIKVTSPSLPTGISAWRLYAGRGTNDPTRTGRFSQAVGAALSVTFEDPVLTGTNPPAVSTIADSSPALFKGDGLDTNGQPLVLLNGDGSGRMGPYAWDNTGKGTASPAIPDTGWLTLATASGWTAGGGIKYRKIGNTVTVVVNGITNNAALSVSVTGSVTDQTISAALPAAYCPDYTLRGQVLMSRQGVAALTTGGQIILQAMDGYGTAYSIAAGTSTYATFTYVVS